MLGLFALGVCAVQPALAQEVSETELAEVSETETEETEAGEDILSRIKTANTRESFLEKTGGAGIHTIYYDKEGKETYSDYVYIGPDAYAYENSNGDVDVVQDGEGFGFSSDENLPYRYCFLEERSYEAFLEQNQSDYLSVDFSGEELVSEEEQEGTVVVTTELPAKEAAERYEGLLFEEGDSLRFVYTVDAATCILQAQECYEVREDGTESLQSSVRIDSEAEAYEPTQELMDLLNDEDTRTVTFILDPGTAEEQKTEATVGKGCAVTLVQPEGYTGLYTDEACTQAYEPENYTEDAVIYMAKGK